MEVKHWGGFSGVPLGMVYQGTCTMDGVLRCIQGLHIPGMVYWGACTVDKVLGCVQGSTHTSSRECVQGVCSREYTQSFGVHSQGYTHQKLSIGVP